MTLPLPTHAVDEDVDLEYFAIEVRGAKPPFGPARLVAVVADASPELALQAVQEKWGHLYKGQAFSARIVACPGVADPLPVHGWLHFDGPGMACCPHCRRAMAAVPVGYRWSVRLKDDQRAKGTAGGHGIHTCQRSNCRRLIEIVVSQAPAKGGR